MTMTELMPFLIRRLPKPKTYIPTAGKIHHIYINGKRQEFPGPGGINLPVLNRRDYILGQAPYDTSITNKVTRLSFLPLTQILYRQLESTTGANENYRDYTGRYRNLDALKDLSGKPNEFDSNALYKLIFDNTETPETVNSVEKNAPILGIPVQSGTIHYNAIPPKTYFFQLIRRYNKTVRDSSISAPTNIKNKITSASGKLNACMNLLCREYALCDGKILRQKNTTKDGNTVLKTEYPAINTTSLNYMDLSTNNLYSIMGDSMSNGTSSTVKTPNLFSLSQYSLRFLRGLPCNKTHDQVGLHYANYNYKSISSNFSGHYHNLFADENVTGINTLGDASTKNIFMGTYTGTVPPNSGNEWKNYVNLTTTKYKGSYMMRSVSHLGLSNDPRKIKKIRDLAINRIGNYSKDFHPLSSCCRYGKKKVGKCMNSRTRCSHLSLGDGGYILRGTSTLPTDTATRQIFPTSIQMQSKYGKTGNDYCETLTRGNDEEYSYANYYTKPGTVTSIIIDDTLPNPHSINLLPIIKI